MKKRSGFCRNAFVLYNYDAAVIKIILQIIFFAPQKITRERQKINLLFKPCRFTVSWVKFIWCTTSSKKIISAYLQVQFSFYIFHSKWL